MTTLLTWTDAGLAAAAVLLMMWAVWVASVPLRDVSIVDWFWGPAFALLGWVLLARLPDPSTRGVVLMAAVTLWAVRLARHLFLRSRGSAEDPRYAAMRERGGASYWWISLFKVFLFQGVLVLVIGAPIFQVVGTPADLAPWGWLDALAGIVFVTGLVFEAVGDHQLTLFRDDPANRGKVLDRGLWRYTRHPNYFGDALVWWGVGLFACNTPSGWLSLFGPAIMTLLLWRVSGASLLESGLKLSRPGYLDYIQRTSEFVPWFPRKRNP